MAAMSDMLNAAAVRGNNGSAAVCYVLSFASTCSRRRQLSLSFSVPLSLSLCTAVLVAVSVALRLLYRSARRGNNTSSSPHLLQAKQFAGSLERRPIAVEWSVQQIKVQVLHSESC